MPFGSLKLPAKQPVPDEPPSRLVWTVVFFAVTIVEIFSVLLLWPRGEPTQTPWFWTCLTVYPLGIATFIVLRRYSVFEGRRLDAIAWNDACEQYASGVVDAASRPIDVLAVSYRISSDAEENEISGLASRTPQPETQGLTAPGAPPGKARMRKPPAKGAR